MDRVQSAKFISSGSIMILVFYVFLAIFSDGLRDTSLPGMSAVQILFIPLIIAFIGIGFASYNLGFDSDEPWERGKIIAILIAISIIILLLAQLSLIVAGVDEDIIIRPVFFYIGDILMIISSLSFSLAFFFFRRQLLTLYFKKIVVKYPNFLPTLSFGLQAVAYCLFFGASFSQGDVLLGIDIAGIIIASISVLLLIGGLIPVNISFRAYSHLVDDESLR
ncbi:MAG: hypothetical protein H7641_07880 [Candidatus Heimdallarchaeota archaeon]|nr:hypothetical protein [Candidatus Heimdallarchaeota archaeon]MCK4877482.1 hypothetical protein [Candidatus Heimdallarchaeota archaeon]